MPLRVASRSRTQNHVLDALPRMAKFIDEGKRNPKVRLLATRILNENRVRGRDEEGEVEALLSWAQREVPYRRDPIGLEGLQSVPFQLTALAHGAQGADCDDFTVFLGSLLGSIGYKTRFAVTRPREGFPFGHVYPEVYLPRAGRWVPADATNAAAPLGWEADYAEKRVFPMQLSGPFDFIERQADKLLSRGRRELEKRTGIGSDVAGGEPVAAPRAASSSMMPILVAVGIGAALYFLFGRKGR